MMRRSPILFLAVLLIAGCSSDSTLSPTAEDATFIGEVAGNGMVPYRATANTTFESAGFEFFADGAVGQDHDSER